MRLDLLSLASETSTAQSFERRVLSELQRTIGFDAAFFASKGGEALPTVVGLDPATIGRALAGQREYGRELEPVKAAALAGDGVAVDSEVLGLSALHATRYYNELVRPVGGQHSLFAYLTLRGRWLGAIMLGRAGRPFKPRESRELAALLPQLSVARASYLGLGSSSSSSPIPVPLSKSKLSWHRRLGAGLGLSRRASVVTPQGTISVRDRRGYREMVCEEDGRELVWSRAKLQDPSRSGWPYVDLFHVAANLASQRRRALFIGCGGAVSVRQFESSYPGIELYLVERDPAVIELAREWYDLDAIANLRVEVGDGLEFVTASEAARWDIAIVDAYGSDPQLPVLAVERLFSELKRVLCPGGVAAFNVIGSLAGEGPVETVIRAAATVFEEVRVLPVVTADEDYSAETPRNVVVIGAG